MIERYELEPLTPEEIGRWDEVTAAYPNQELFHRRAWLDYLVERRGVEIRYWGIQRGATRRLLDQVKTWAILDTRHEDMKNALPGSSPVCGPYEPLRFQNWGAKFFADTLAALVGGPEHGSAEPGGRELDRR